MRHLRSTTKPQRWIGPATLCMKCGRVVHDAFAVDDEELVRIVREHAPGCREAAGAVRSYEARVVDDLFRDRGGYRKFRLKANRVNRPKLRAAIKAEVAVRVAAVLNRADVAVEAAVG